MTWSCLHSGHIHTTWVRNIHLVTVLMLAINFRSNLTECHYILDRNGWTYDTINWKPSVVWLLPWALQCVTVACTICCLWNPSFVIKEAGRNVAVLAKLQLHLLLKTLSHLQHYLGDPRLKNMVKIMMLMVKWSSDDFLLITQCQLLIVKYTHFQFCWHRKQRNRRGNTRVVLTCSSSTYSDKLPDYIHFCVSDKPLLWLHYYSTAYATEWHRALGQFLRVFVFFVGFCVFFCWGGGGGGGIF